MCAEAVPWRCHRSLVSDALVAAEFRSSTLQAAEKHKSTS